MTAAPAARTRVWLLLAVALTLVAASLGLSGTAVAAAEPAGPETVGAEADVSAGQRLEIGSVSYDLSSGSRVATNAARPTNSAYSVAYEVELSPSVLGRSRNVHFNRANQALDDAVRADPDFAARMDQLIPGVADDVASAGGRTTPQNWTWHHAPSSQAGGRQGVMQLVPTEQHAPGSIWQQLFHPNGAGGYSEWAIPNGAPPN